ncbi:uncharacterized protein LOC131440411 [Malaya genurostris]|uniref:uncharacterized protein LOC131440411 n=1 Tax=Malaya genurostris TaxID=325434 RepID=UPI0026F38BC9|nr:uncharacterized protein LOC131440411 [Malaya genurostris]
MARRTSVGSYTELQSVHKLDEESQLPDYCRLCLAENVQMVTPKDNKAFTHLTGKIKDCLQLAISVEDLSHSLICKKCYESLEQYNQFRLRCTRYATYLSMRKSLHPDRKQLLRYGDNWYWYSCMGKNLHSVIWGCSVVCCPAYIVSYPSGKVCTKNANHLHKQRMEEVKSVYSNGEFVYDGYRFSFDLITHNRSLMFECKSLNDPKKKCKAILITNDRSEVLSMGEHSHARETIIESAVKDCDTGYKQAVTLIRGPLRELVLCQGFWYETVSRQSSESYWNCIRPSCLGAMTMTNGVVEFHGSHFHQPVWLKWGFQVQKNTEPRSPVLMKIINPPSVPKTHHKLVTIPVGPTIQQHTLKNDSAFSKQHATQTNSSIQRASSSMPTDQEFKIEKTRRVSPNSSKLVDSVCISEQPVTFSNSAFGTHKRISDSASTTTSDLSIPKIIPSSDSTVESQSKVKVETIQQKPLSRGKLNVRQNHFIKPIPFKSHRQLQPTPTPVGIPKILHVMSLNKDASNRIRRPLPPVTVPQPLVQSTIKTENEYDTADEEEEPETITDEILPTFCQTVVNDKSEEQSLDVPRPMMLVASGSITKDNTLKVTALDSTFDGNISRVPSLNVPNNQENNSGTTENTLSTEQEEDSLRDLQDDDEVPPIIPIDVNRPGSTGKQVATPRTVTPQSVVSEVSKSTFKSEPSPVHTYNVDRFKRIVSPLKNRSFSTLPQKRFGSEIQFHGTTIKKLKTSTKSSGAKERTVIDIYETIELGEHNGNDDSVMEDPIAVPTEPHELIGVRRDSNNQEQDSMSENDVQSGNIQPATNPGEDDNNLDDNSSCPILEDAHRSTSQPGVAVPTEQLKPLMTKETTNTEKKLSDVKKTIRTVQLVKLQKSEQMLNFEGHLYKIKWCHQRSNFWDCMLREQVQCPAILETKGNDSQSWTKYGLHNHKVPKPVANEENAGRYQMLSATKGIMNVKLPVLQTVKIEDIKEQEGQMMYLRKRKLFKYKIGLENSKPKLYFIDYVYDIKEPGSPGFRWQCVTCSSILDTDEKFSIAKEVAENHNHEPVQTVVDLIKNDVDGSKVSPKDTIHTSPLTKSIEVTEQPKKVGLTTPNAQQSKDGHSEDDGVEDLFANAPGNYSVQPDKAEEQSDDDEVVLDSLSGQFMSKMDMKRKQNRAILLGNEDEDDDEEILDPLTGKFRRKGDIDQEENVAEDVEIDDNSQQSKPEDDLPNEDFEELLKGTSNGETSRQKNFKKFKSNSLAALKQEISLHKKLRDVDTNRNFEILIQDDNSCLIRFNAFTYQLDNIQETFSVWKCHLSPQYACRGKIHLNNSLMEVSVGGVNHCHVASVRDMFIAHTDQEEGKISDKDREASWQYTFYKLPKSVFLLRLDDGYFYSCQTISNSGVSCWRCAQRQSLNCKAIATMEGDFLSLARNRFAHSHEKPVGDSTNDGKNVPFDISQELVSTKSAELKKIQGDRKKQKRQTV